MATVARCISDVFKVGDVVVRDRKLEGFRVWMPTRSSVLDTRKVNAALSAHPISTSASETARIGRKELLQIRVTAPIGDCVVVGAGEVNAAFSVHKISTSRSGTARIGRKELLEIRVTTARGSVVVDAREVNAALSAHRMATTGSETARIGRKELRETARIGRKELVGLKVTARSRVVDARKVYAALTALHQEWPMDAT
jgi:hypothetical protein